MRKNRMVTIIAQDPGVRIRGKILTARVLIPDENVAPGPKGHRVSVVDYDSTTRTLYAPAEIQKRDPFATATDHQLLNNPAFHAQNVYTIVTRTLNCFENALGRRIPWSFGGHQIKVIPHAFSDANAFYSKQNEALLFGYFPSPQQPRKRIFTCLSHDVVVHETTHALLDGIKPRFMDPAGPDQGGFHEGFADTIAILSVFSLPEIVYVALDPRPVQGRWQLRKSLLLSVAKEIGREINQGIHRALRQPTLLRPSKNLIHRVDYQMPHPRGEILVAALLNAFLAVWERRVKMLSGKSRYPKRDCVIEEGAHLAGYLLNLCIRALDYTPPIDLSFGDFLSALLTADVENSYNNSTVNFRHFIRTSFESFGIHPSASGQGRERGIWNRYSKKLNYNSIHFDSMQRDSEEIHRFLWLNRAVFGLHPHSLLKVESVKTSTRIGPDGFLQKETIGEYVESLTVRAGDLAWMSSPIRKPSEMPSSQKIRLTGGGTLIFNERGKVKYHIANPLGDSLRQSRLLDHLWKTGHFCE